MAKNSSNCIIEFKLYTEKWHADFLEKMFNCGERIYNTMIRYSAKQLKALEADEEYQTLLSQYKLYLNKKELTKAEEKAKKALSSKLNKKVKSYGLSEFQFHDYVKKMKNESFVGIFDINTAQKIATAAWKAVSEYLYGDGEKLHFKKRGDMCSLEGKTNKSGIKFDKKINAVKIGTMIMPIKVRVKDTYAHKMLELPICYCRIVRKPFKTGYKYFVQLILKGEPAELPELGVGDAGLDQGTSTLAGFGDKKAVMFAHGVTDNKTYKDYNKKIVALSTKLERQRRLNNPQNYNEDGTVKKGVKLQWNNSKGYYKTLFELKDAYRRKTAFVRQGLGYQANEILKLGDTFYTEPMDWKVLQKRSKKTEKSDKTIEIKAKNGKTKIVRKNKKKKRYGQSLNDHSPGYQERIIIQKLAYHHKALHYVNLATYRASQYNPETKEYKKAELSERVKKMFDKLIQRDLLSAFLLQNPLKNLMQIDIDKIEKKIDKFIELHDRCIKELKTKKNLPDCVGMKNFK